MKRVGRRDMQVEASERARETDRQTGRQTKTHREKGTMREVELETNTSKSDAKLIA